MDTILNTVATASFVEKVLLLLLGVLLTGLLVPVVKARMDRTSFEGQKLFEAHAARYSDLIKAQTHFLSRSKPTRRPFKNTEIRCGCPFTGFAALVAHDGSVPMPHIYRIFEVTCYPCHAFGLSGGRVRSIPLPIYVVRMRPAKLFNARLLAP